MSEKPMVITKQKVIDLIMIVATSQSFHTRKERIQKLNKYNLFLEMPVRAPLKLVEQLLEDMGISKKYPREQLWFGYPKVTTQIACVKTPGEVR